MSDPEIERLRPHPESRFASPQHQYNLAEVVSKLKNELNAGEAGHRQETLYKRPGITISLFVFEHLTRLSPHRAKGLVTIQVLDGQLQITAENQSHDLKAGSLLVLAPGVMHDVVAREESAMLLTVNLDANPNGSV